MAKLLDYPCSYDNASGLGQWGEKNNKLQFPQVYTERQQIAELAQTIRCHEGGEWCLLPFCHTLEAEAMGANIIYGDGLTGPRVRGHTCNSLDEAMERTVDWQNSRLQETLFACALLKERCENVLFQLSGPLTVLNSLLPAELLFRSLRKEPEKVLVLLHKFGEDSLHFAKLAEKAGAHIISYADPMAGVGIIGPKFAELLTKTFTADYLQKLDAVLEKETMILLCPKTSFALLGTELAEWREHPLPEKMNYGKAALALRGKIRFGGQSCVKKTAYETEIFREVVLKEAAE